jgi:hypothetical protein
MCCVGEAVMGGIIAVERQFELNDSGKTKSLRSEDLSYIVGASVGVRLPVHTGWTGGADSGLAN